MSGTQVARRAGKSAVHHELLPASEIEVCNYNYWKWCWYLLQSIPWGLVGPRRLTWNQQKWRFRRLIFHDFPSQMVLMNPFFPKVIWKLVFFQVKKGITGTNLSWLDSSPSPPTSPRPSRCWSPIKQLSLWPWTYGPSVTSNLTSFLVQLGELSLLGRWQSIWWHWWRMWQLVIPCFMVQKFGKNSPVEVVGSWIPLFTRCIHISPVAIARFLRERKLGIVTNIWCINIPGLILFVYFCGEYHCW